MTKPKTLRCSICQNPIPTEPGGWTNGHNAEPINHGRCCRDCNTLVVIPARILQAVKWLRERDHEPQ